MSSPSMGYPDSVFSQHGRIAEALEIPAGRFINSGMAGCTFEAGSYILKLTLWIEEAESWALIERQQRRVPSAMLGFATVAREPVGVRLPDGDDVFAIVRENVDDADIEWSDVDESKLVLLREIACTHHRGIVDRAKDFFTVLDGLPQKHFGLIRQSLAHIHMTEGVLLSDLTLSNFGIRIQGTEELVIRDPGPAIGKERWQPSRWIEL